MTDRVPVRDLYDATVRVSLGDKQVKPYALVKETWSIAPGRRPAPTAPVPLVGDLKGGEENTERAGWAPGSDFWPFKSATDVIVEGSVWAADPPAFEAQAEIVVGERRKRIRAVGERVIEWRNGRPRIGPPEPFEHVGLELQNAYGGVDYRVPAEEPESLLDLLAASTDHPGIYPRNPHGRGYLVLPDEPPDQVVELPRLEDPQHPLTDENLLVEDPRRWHKQPLPCFLGWGSPAQFPRSWFVGAKPWYPVPDDEVLEEVRRGFLNPDWRTMVDEDDPIHLGFLQEASDGLVFADLAPGTPIRLRGMHPEHRELVCEVPRAPQVEIEAAGVRERCEPHLMHLVLVPDELVLKATWVAWFQGDAPMFVPGLHAEIPVAVRVNGDAPIPCHSPEPIRAKLKQAVAEGRLPPMPSIVSSPSEELLQGRALGRPPQRERDQVPFDEATTLGEVDVASGRVLLRHVDWAHPSTGLRWTRYYSSSMAWRDGPLGLGWSHAFAQELWYERGHLWLATEDGRELALPLRGGDLALGQTAHHPPAGLTVRRIAADAHEVFDGTGARRRFVEMPGSNPAKARRALLAGGVTADGLPWSLQPDSRGRIAKLVVGGREVLRLEYDAHDHLVRVEVSTADGSAWAVAAAYEYDSFGLLRRARDVAGRTVEHDYDQRRLVRVRGAHLNHRFDYEGQDRDARCVRQLGEGDETTREVAFDPAERLVVCTPAAGGAFSVGVTDHHRVRRVLDPFAHETTRSYDEASGLVTSQTTPDGETTFLYDADFHLADVTAPDRGSIALEHDAYGHLEKLTDADGNTSRWGWDELGRLTAAVWPTGASVLFDFDGDGPLKSVLTPGEVRLHLERDPRSQGIARIIAPTGARSARRDALTRIVEVRDELEQVTAFRYDPCGRVAQVEHPTGLVRAFDSDAEGRVTSIQDGVSRLTLERDGLGQLARVDEGDGGPTLHRDAEGRVTMVESEAIDFWELIRDAAGRVTEETTFEDGKLHHLRDHNGRVRRTLRGRHRTTVKRDKAARPVELEHSDESFQRFAWSPGGRLTHAQEADRLVALENDGAGRPTLEKQGEHWVRNRYDATGRRAALDTSLGLAVRVERDVLGGAMSLVAQRGEQRLELRFERDAAGRETKRHLPGGLALRWQRDGLGRPTERAVMLGERALATLRFAWQGLDRLVRVEDPSRGVRDHRHDARGRLVQAGGVVRALDEVGNVYRTNARDDHRYAPGGRLVESQGIEYAYDEAGFRTEKVTPLGDRTRYRWDPLGRLVRVELSEDRHVVYDYDALGRRVRRQLAEKVEFEGLDEPVWEPISETFFFWDGLELVHEVTGGEVTSWIWEAGRLVGLVTNDGAYAVLTDPLGCPTEIVDGKGNVVWRGTVDVFGALQKERAQVACPWRLPGHWEDPDTGLQHAWLRVYDPETGAYLSPNPLGVAAGTNLYAYLPDPLSETSPLGLSRGYATFGGELRSERLEAELIERFVAALDRGDGAAGPRERFDPEAAAFSLPDPEAFFWGPWARYRVSEQLPPPTSSFTRLPETCGLRGR